MDEYDQMIRWLAEHQIPSIKEMSVAEWRIVENRYEQEFRAELERVYGTAGNPKAGMLYGIAWDNGHAYGFSEVLGHYDRLAVLIR